MFPVQRLECNQTEVDYPRESTVHELFMEQAARTPEATAVIAGDCRLSYRQLDELSNRLARHLQSLGVKPETMVGIAMERSETLIVGLLAILKAVGAGSGVFSKRRLAAYSSSGILPILGGYFGDRLHNLEIQSAIGREFRGYVASPRNSPSPRATMRFHAPRAADRRADPHGN